MGRRSKHDVIYVEGLQILSDHGKENPTNLTAEGIRDYDPLKEIKIPSLLESLLLSEPVLEYSPMRLGANTRL